MTDRGVVLDCLAFAVSWAVEALAIFGVLVLGPFSGWTTSEKVSLFQAFVVIAGFGTALPVVGVTVWQVVSDPSRSQYLEDLRKSRAGPK
jgi:hypothetical protein